MIRATTAGLLLAGLVLIAGAAAQPGDGDVVLSVNTTDFRTRQFTGRIIVYNPAVGVFTTLAQTIPSWSSSDLFSQLFVAEDNRHLLEMRPIDRGFRYRRITPNGIVTTLLVQNGGDNSAPLAGPDLLLDGDGGWIMAGPLTRGLWRFDERTLTVSTLFDYGPQSAQRFRSLAPSFSPEGDYWVLNDGWKTTHPQLLGVTRSGVVTTLLLRNTPGPFTFSTRIRSEPHTGGAWVARQSSGWQSTPGVAFVSHRSATGALTTLVLGPGVETRSVSVAQDGTLWAIRVRSNAVQYLADELHHFAPDGTSLLTRQIPGTIPTTTTAGATPSLALYGHRRLTVRGPGTPGSTATIQMTSLRPADGGRSYQLACSLARRPAVKAANGEWLHLAPDPLFFLSSSGSATQMFRSFSGVLTASGRATASIHVPAAFPRGLDLPVFVAGVVYDSSGIRTVTNTHWLVLR